MQHKIRILFSVRPETPVVKHKLTKSSLLNPLQKLLGNNLVGIDVDAIQRRHSPAMHSKWFHDLFYRRLLKLPIPDVGEMPRNRGSRRHHRTHQMRPTSASLPPFEIAIARGSAALSRLQNIRIHSQTHRASRLAPLKSRILKDPVQPFLLGCTLHRLRSGHDHGSHFCVDVMSFGYPRRRPQILQPRIRARSNEHAIDCDLFNPPPRFQRHILQREFSRASIVLLQSLHVRDAPRHRRHHSWIRSPSHKWAKLRRIDLDDSIELRVGIRRQATPIRHRLLPLLIPRCESFSFHVGDGGLIRCHHPGTRARFDAHIAQRHPPFHGEGTHGRTRVFDHMPGGAIGHVIEYAGPAVRALSMEGRMTLCNMSIEAGARAGMVAPDETTIAYVKGKRFAPRDEEWEKAVAYWRSLPTDSDAKFDRVIEIDAAQLCPFVTWGTNPGMVAPVTGRVPDVKGLQENDRRAAELALQYMALEPGRRIEEIAIDRVFIGSCTNSRLEDLRAAARVAKGHHVNAKVRAMVVPGSQTVKRAAEQEGLHRIFQDAGFEWRESGCSMCLGMNPDILQPGERCASTSNRNFEGRQGRGGRTHLVSPMMAAAAAIAGHFTDIRDWKFQL